ncbi:HlyD family secretion protein [Enterobacter hormaechei]|nr:HlyD family secretion protein [Enterobacter hormaechei]
MSQQDAAKEQANTRKNVRVVSIFTAAAIGIVGVLVILYACSCPRLRVMPSLRITPTCAARPRSSVRR